MDSEPYPALLVDLYELMMADAYRRDAMAARPATFSLFVRTLPPERSVLIAAGLDDALSWLEGLRFGPEELAAVEQLGVFDDAFLAWLGDLRFTGTVRAMPEGTPVFAGEPILEVDAPIAEAQLAETFLLNQITLQTTLATKAARCRHAAGDRGVIDFGLRRAQGIDAGMKLARVGGLVGLTATSNVAGATRYGVRASGTMAHSFVQAHASEAAAFRAFSQAFGPTTVLLVDTYDPIVGIDRAIATAGECRRAGVEIRGVRIDSGDLAALSREGRRRLDDAGFPGVQVFVSGGLDEYEISRLVDEAAPIDGFGVGSALGVSADAPTLDTVYKLVAVDGRPVRKTSVAKETWPGAKQVWRAPDWSRDTLALRSEPPPGSDDLALLTEVMRDGERTVDGRRTLVEANAYFEREWERLPDGVKAITNPAAPVVVVSTPVRDLAAQIDRDRERTEAP